MKKKIFWILALCFFVGVTNVNAESEYYSYRWTNSYGTEPEMYSPDDIITNDVINVPEGFLTVGFDHERGDRPRVRLLNHDGVLIKEINLDTDLHGKLKEIIKVGDRYYIFGGYENETIFIVLDSDYKVVAQRGEIYTSLNWDSMYNVYNYDEGAGFEVYVEYYNGHFYFYDPDVPEVLLKASEFLIDIEEVDPYKLYYDEYKFLEDQFVMSEITDYYIAPVFITPFNEGYIHGVYDRDYDEFIVIYVKDGKEVWYKDFGDAFIRDAVEFNGNLILVGDFYGNQMLMVLDKNGKILDQDAISNYYDKNLYTQFMAEHLIVLDNGFALTGTNMVDMPMEIASYNVDTYNMPEPPALDAKVLYFDIDYNVYTKTDGNGIVTPSATTAYAKEEITFEVTPNEGYKVAYVNVTDEYGNTVTFPSNKFTMPYADVTIEAAFTIENPKTGAKIGAITFGALILAVPALVTRKRKDKLFNV